MYSYSRATESLICFGVCGAHTSIQYLDHSLTFPIPHSARVDGLAKREMSVVEMVEHFQDRADRLYYRCVTYAKPVRKFEPADKERKKHIKVSSDSASMLCLVTTLLSSLAGHFFCR